MRTAIAVLALLTALARSETLDRIAVRVGTRVVTGSAIRRQLRMEAFIENRQPDLRPEARRRAAERLIDQTLVQREFELNRYPSPPAGEVDTNLEQIRKARNEDPAAFAASLERYGFTQEDLRAEIYYDIALLRFVDFRFTPAVQVSEEEIREEYEKEVVPEAHRRNLPPPTLEEQRRDIVKLLTYRKTTAALEQWLAQARQQVKIRWFEEAFR